MVWFLDEGGEATSPAAVPGPPRPLGPAASAATNFPSVRSQLIDATVCGWHRPMLNDLILLPYNVAWAE